LAETRANLRFGQVAAGKPSESATVGGLRRVGVRGRA
jgi:hypothetical protein